MLTNVSTSSAFASVKAPGRISGSSFHEAKPVPPGNKRVSFSALPKGNDSKLDEQIAKLSQMEQELRASLSTVTSPDLEKMTGLFTQLKTIVGDTEIVDSECLEEWANLRALFEEITKEEIIK